MGLKKTCSHCNKSSTCVEPCAKIEQELAKVSSKRSYLEILSPDIDNYGTTKKNINSNELSDDPLYHEEAM